MPPAPVTPGGPDIHPHPTHRRSPQISSRSLGKVWVAGIDSFDGLQAKEQPAVIRAAPTGPPPGGHDHFRAGSGVPGGWLDVVVDAGRGQQPAGAAFVDAESRLRRQVMTAPADAV